jgi:hypothetical protein
MRIRILDLVNLGSGMIGSRMEKSRVRDKHPGSATLIGTFDFPLFFTFCDYRVYLLPTMTHKGRNDKCSIFAEINFAILSNFVQIFVKNVEFDFSPLKVKLKDILVLILSKHRHS